MRTNTSERDKDLLNVYREVLGSVSYPFLLSDVICKAIRRPAKKFYCASRGVYETIKKIRAEETVVYCGEERKRLIDDVIVLVKIQEEQYPDKQLKHIVEDVLEGPAPEFYLKPSSAIIILHKIQKHARYVEYVKNQSRNERIQKRKNRKRSLL